MCQDCPNSRAAAPARRRHSDLKANRLRAYRSPRDGVYQLAETRPLERTVLAVMPGVEIDLMPLS
jgi:hypothetical protein